MSELNIVNKAARAVRDEQFKWAKRLDWNNGPIVVSEGDSWFQHPIENDIIDTLSWFSCGYKIRSLGAAGDQLSEMVQHLEFPEAIREENPEAFLFSGGGNDFVDQGLAKSLHDSTNITAARECFDEGPFNAELDKLAALYRLVYRKAQDAKAGIPMFVHGYAHPRPGERYFGVFEWGLAKTLEAKNVRKSLWNRVAALGIDGFNRMLERLEEELPNFHHVDLRPVVGRRDFIDELHLKSSAAAKAAEEFDERIQEVIGRSRNAFGIWS